MNPYKINTKKRPDLSGLKSSTLDQIKQSTSPTPIKQLWSKNLWVGAASVVILTTLGLNYFYTQKEIADFNVPSENDIQIQNGDKIDKENFAFTYSEEEREHYIPTEYFKIKNNRDTVIQSRKGYILELPENSLPDSIEEYTLSFRSIDNPFEQIIAQIPMDFTTAEGEKMQMASDGMFDLNIAEYQGAFQKEITINAPIRHEDLNCNFYHLDPDTKQWGEQYTFNEIKQSILPETINPSQKQVTRISLSSRDSILLNKDFDIFEEQSSQIVFKSPNHKNKLLNEILYDSLMFQVEDSTFMKSRLFIDWSNVSVKKRNKHYFLHLEKGNYKEQYKVKCVLNPENYSKAKNELAAIKIKKASAQNLKNMIPYRQVKIVKQGVYNYDALLKTGLDGDVLAIFAQDGFGGDEVCHIVEQNINGLITLQYRDMYNYKFKKRQSFVFHTKNIQGEFVIIYKIKGQVKSEKFITKELGLAKVQSLLETMDT